jgi:hypothetical protein
MFFLMTDISPPLPLGEGRGEGLDKKTSFSIKLI